MTKAKLIKQLLTLKNIRSAANGRAEKIWAHSERESKPLRDMLAQLREGAAKSRAQGIRYSASLPSSNRYRTVFMKVPAGMHVPAGVPHWGGELSDGTAYGFLTPSIRPARKAILSRIAEIRQRHQNAANILSGRMRAELGIAGGYAGAAGASGYGAYNLIKKLVESRKAQQSTTAQQPGDTSK